MLWSEAIYRLLSSRGSVKKDCMGGRAHGFFTSLLDEHSSVSRSTGLSTGINNSKFDERIDGSTLIIKRNGIELPLAVYAFVVPHIDGALGETVRPT